MADTRRALTGSATPGGGGVDDAALGTKTVSSTTSAISLIQAMEDRINGPIFTGPTGMGTSWYGEDGESSTASQMMRLTLRGWR